MLINLEGKPAHGCLALRQDLPIGLQNKVTNKNKSIIHQQYVNLPLVRRRYPEESTYTTIHLQSRFFRHTRKQNACLHTSSHRSTTQDDRRRSGDHYARDGREPQSVEGRLGARVRWRQRWLFSGVCTGAGFLGHQGVFAGKPATTH
jgi:hypothetical protein